ncbi:MAG TPA: hypothetical protein PLL64_04095 [Rhodothermales bacterium]|nr:hypothetical protein [Bacteroidota bacterium]HRK73432.1 hypothetical protein [Rhodothermales bacterium]HRR09411.1 hypothetical protein [Rhodothermales bacterium]
MRKTPFKLGAVVLLLLFLGGGLAAPWVHLVHHHSDFFCHEHPQHKDHESGSDDCSLCDAIKYQTALPNISLKIVPQLEAVAIARYFTSQTLPFRLEFFSRPSRAPPVG